MADDDGWGFADMYDMEVEDSGDAGPLEDIKSDDWRNILVFGRATKTGVFPETLSLVGHAKYLADGLGCRVEVLLVGENLEAACKVLEDYPVDTIYTVAAPDYAAIDQTATILQEVVNRRRPELVMLFQSRSGDAMTAFAASRLGAGFALGASKVEIDTADRKTVVTHQGKNTDFQILSEFRQPPAFVSVQRGLFRVPMQDTYSPTKIHEIEVKGNGFAKIEVKGRRDPPEATVETAERVVLAGSRVQGEEGMNAARQLAEKLDAALAVTRAVVDRGLSKEDDVVVGVRARHVKAARLVVAVGCTGSLDVLEALPENTTLVAIGSGASDPINGRALYRVEGEVAEATTLVINGL